ncbi:MAG: sensor histidine kinase, partial [Ramlibacter sp.]
MATARAIGHALRDALVPSNRPARLGVGLFVAGLLATGVATVRTVQSVRAEALTRFQSQAERLEASVVRQLHRAEQVLLVAAAADIAVGGFDRQRFRTYVQALDAAGELQPVQSLGWVERVERDQLPAFVARQRADGAPDFAVRSDASTRELLVVAMTEPGARAAAAWGLDMAISAPRHEAAQRAIETGQVTLSAPLHLLNDRQRTGWLMMKPVYRAGLPLDTPEHRRAALRGLLYAPMVAAELLSSVRGGLEEGLQFEVYDGLASARPPIYASRMSAGAAGRPGGDADSATIERRLDVGGRVLTLRVGNDLHSADAYRGASAVAFGGLALSLLLALALVRVLRATERAEARSRRMQQDLQRMQELTQHTTGVLLGLDGRLRVRWVNAGFTLITGWAEADCVGQPVSRLARAADGGMELPQAADRLRHGASHLRLELVASRKDGSPCWLDADLQPEGDGFLLTAGDITGRREAERRLAESEHMMRLMTDSIDARLTYWDTDLRCRLANRTAARFAGRRRSQVLGMGLVDLMGADAYRQLAPRLERALSGEPQRFEWTWPGSDGRETVSLIQYMPDIDGGHVRGMFAFALDITELKEAQRTALRANEAKSQFLSHMSHEIRTPMNAILGMLALLRGTGLDQRQGDFAGKAEAAARSLLGLLNDLLDLSKIESGKMQLDPAPFRPDLLLRDLAAILDGAAHARDLRLAFELDPAIPPVLVGDDMRLRQVLVNLGGNAVKFTRSGEVLVSVRLLERRAGQARIEIAVRDTGIGIAPQDQERIFSDFSQAASSTTREFGGTGLGLGICRRLVGMMGGQLWLESRPGRGSRFWFELTLPVAAEDSVPSSDHASVPAEVTGGDALAG